MIVYLGSIRKLEQFNKETVVQNVSNDVDTIGFWLTSDIKSAIPYAKGTETVIEKSNTQFWEDGEPKVVQTERSVSGFIYKVYMDEPTLKEYESNSEDSFDLFMRERDTYCDYLGTNKRKLTWKDQPILLNKEEAHEAFRKRLISQGYDGLLIRNMRTHDRLTDLYCIFSGDSLHIADVIPLDAVDK